AMVHSSLSGTVSLLLACVQRHGTSIRLDKPLAHEKVQHGVDTISPIQTRTGTHIINTALGASCLSEVGQDRYFAVSLDVGI
ncbi:hypothetical protein KIPB_016058, partial [Kipferlia bialata]